MHSIPETRIEVDAPRDIGGSILATIYTARIRNTDANSSFSSRMETASAGKAFSRYVSAFIAQRFDSSPFFLFLQRRTRSIYSRNLSIGDDQFQILFPFLASSRLNRKIIFTVGILWRKIKIIPTNRADTSLVPNSIKRKSCRNMKGYNWYRERDTGMEHVRLEQSILGTRIVGKWIMRLRLINSIRRRRVERSSMIEEFRIREERHVLWSILRK